VEIARGEPSRDTELASRESKGLEELAQARKMATEMRAVSQREQAEAMAHVLSRPGEGARAVWSANRDGGKTTRICHSPTSHWHEAARSPAPGPFMDLNKTS
jgi:hypothetical protein